ncbi:uncharacterized protein [Dermacentor andersoni]|uniref:uncharacterized protein n=1 Tax=Dermacentor andersoni TaxID=34620 RepID=UPI002155A253|nr:uncharacterized protein LOC126519100 [Dermacentor andersoni]
MTFAQMQGPLRLVALTRLYHQVMLPALTYASAVWWSAKPDHRLSARVTSMQRTVLLSLSGAFRTTRMASLQVLMRVPPLSLELDRTAVEFRLFALREAVERSRAASLHVFTDGSYTPLSSGAAFVILSPGERIGALGRFRVHAATSAYCAEVLAFAEALAHVRGREGTGAVSIYADCLSLLQAVATPGSNDPRVTRIKTALVEIARSSEVRLHHVPGHCGVFGNELADFLASRAARNGFDLNAPQPFKSVRAAFRAVQ